MNCKPLIIIRKYCLNNFEDERELFLLYCKCEKSQGKNMKEVQREERTDLFYFNRFALWIRMNKRVELNTLFKMAGLA